MKFISHLFPVIFQVIVLLLIAHLKITLSLSGQKDIEIERYFTAHQKTLFPKSFTETCTHKIVKVRVDCGDISRRNAASINPIDPTIIRVIQLRVHFV